MNVAEIFKSIQGETTRAGLPCAFVRLSGCNLSCSWCDTPYARNEAGEVLDVDAVAGRLLGFGTRLVCITGGEPLLQPDEVAALASKLVRAGRTVTVETNGTRDLSVLPGGIVVIMDVKCPSSGHAGSELPDNLGYLTARDELKFILADRADFDWALDWIRARGLDAAPGLDGPVLLMGAVAGRLEPSELAGWVLASGVDIRLQLQLHKILWPGAERGV